MTTTIFHRETRGQWITAIGPEVEKLYFAILMPVIREIEKHELYLVNKKYTVHEVEKFSFC